MPGGNALSRATAGSSTESPWPFVLTRNSETVDATITIGAHLSDAIDFRDLTMMIVRMPVAWTVASIGFHVSDTEAGTFLPIYDEDGAILEIVTPVADTAYAAPPALSGAHWVKLWSQTAGADVAQVAERVLPVDMKS